MGSSTFLQDKSSWVHICCEYAFLNLCITKAPAGRHLQVSSRKVRFFGRASGRAPTNTMVEDVILFALSSASALLKNVPCRWRGTEMLPMSTERIEQNADFSLKLRSVGLKDLGPYSCQVRSPGSPGEVFRGYSYPLCQGVLLE